MRLIDERRLFLAAVNSTLLFNAMPIQGRVPNMSYLGMDIHPIEGGGYLVRPTSDNKTTACAVMRHQDDFMPDGWNFVRREQGFFVAGYEDVKHVMEKISVKPALRFVSENTVLW